MMKVMEFMSWKFSQTMWMWELTCLFLRYLLVKFSEIYFLEVASRCICKLYQPVNYFKPVLQIVLHDSAGENVFATGGQIHVPIYVTGIIKVSNAEIAVVDSDLGSVETQKKYVFVSDLRSFLQLYSESVCFITDYVPNSQIPVILYCV